jgi:DNA-binding PadR family transcriptional regulator
LEAFIKTTELEYVILGLVSMNDFSGYDIKKIFDKSYIIRWSASPGSIYPALKRLEKRGLLKSKRILDGKIPKEVYSITEEGKIKIKEWLKEPFKGNAITRFGLELKLLFLHNLTNQERKVFLTRQIEEINKCIDNLPKWKIEMDVKNRYRDMLYEEKLREFKQNIKFIESLLEI